MYTVSYPIHNGTLSLHKDDVDIFDIYLKIESQKTGARASVKYRLPAEFKNITSKDFQIF